MAGMFIAYPRPRPSLSFLFLLRSSRTFVEMQASIERNDDMKTLFLLGVVILYALLASPVAKAQSAGVSTTPLNNRDVVFMVRQKLDSAEIVRIIQASPCTFDIFPPVLRDLKRRGVPDSGGR